MTPALELLGITKRYDSVVALDDASLTVRPGTIHAVLGENGAGKTTLMRVAYGMVSADSGIVRVRGAGKRLASPLDAIAAGIGMVHQHFTLVPAMTVAENLVLGGRGRLRERETISQVHDIAARTGFSLDPSARVETLSVGAQQRVEIAKALARNASLLILDEPTAVLAPSEIEDLLQWLRQYVGEGNAAVLITHKLREALAVADDVSVLRHGRQVLAGPASAISTEQLTLAMIGQQHGTDRVQLPRPPATAPLRFDVEHIAILDEQGRTRIRDTSFQVRSGEVLGIAGVEGAGQYHLLRALAGRIEISRGRMMRPATIGFVPEDRHRDAVLLDRSLSENIALNGAGTRRGTMEWNTFHQRTRALMQEFDVRAPDERTHVRVLSGGNQQKLVLARELSSIDGAPVEALVVENPTRGLDVRATTDVHSRLRDAAATGAAVVVYSSDLDEVLTIASRVLVMFDGTAREVPMDRDSIGRAMIGLSEAKGPAPL